MKTATINYAEILRWAEKGLEAELCRQKQMLSVAESSRAPSASDLRALLTKNINELSEKRDRIKEISKDPTGLGY